MPDASVDLLENLNLSPGSMWLRDLAAVCVYILTVTGAFVVLFRHSCCRPTARSQADAIRPGHHPFR